MLASLARSGWRQTPRVAKYVRNLHQSTPFNAVRPFLLADIGEGITEVEVLQWFIEEGAEISEFDPICEVQSDKANVEISSRYKGKVTKRHYEEGDIAIVGEALISIDVEDDEADDDSQEAATPSSPAASEEAPTPAVSEVSAAPVPPSPTRQGGKILTTPAVRNIARNNNLDLSLVHGTGKAGRILKGDVLEYLEQLQTGQPSAPPQQLPFAGSDSNDAPRVEKVRGVKRLMVQTMEKSLEIPHFVYADEYDMANTSKARAALNASGETKMSYMPLILKAASLALSQYPVLNSSLSEDKTEIHYHPNHNIGVAIDTPNGLVVPNIKSVNKRSVREINDELVRLQAAGKTGNFLPEDLRDTTFSLSNIGAIGGTYAGPVIATPQVSIGAIGKIQKLPRFDADGNVVKAEIMCASWAADHRIIDGATMARFSNLLKAYLEEPMTMLSDLR